MMEALAQAMQPTRQVGTTDTNRNTPHWESTHGLEHPFFR
jgi:hypothetical protein